MVQVNLGKEPSKSGVDASHTIQLIRDISGLDNLKIKGLMAMPPFFDDPEDARPYFQKTREAFERILSMNLPNVTMRYLSMGMTNSYQVAIAEGANIVRIGTKIFG